ncbi:unnamed protein product, partial [Gongylonema pulchrum]|uniref:Uncharacterized protein n=1 Tax=Gongylonema pulchrum TaxID=637853 RepID=A0A183DLF9_9BILA
MDSVEFSLECCWLLDAYGAGIIRKLKRKSQGHRLRQAILNEFRDISNGVKIFTKPPSPSRQRRLRSRSEAVLPVAGGSKLQQQADPRN